MDTVAMIVLVIGVLIVPMYCAYLVVGRMARRQDRKSRPKSGEKTAA